MDLLDLKRWLGPSGRPARRAGDKAGYGAASALLLCFAVTIVLYRWARRRNNKRMVEIKHVVTIEEHFMSSAYLTASRSESKKYHAFGNIDDLGDARVRDMDAARIAIQVVSLAPGPPKLFTPYICQASNDQLYQGIKNSNGRLAGLATLPMGNVPQAVLELEKAIGEYGMKGVLINNHMDGEFYDDEKYWPVFAKAQELGVPIYLHPCPPNAAMHDLLYASSAYSEAASFALGTAGFGWHEMTGLHVLRLVLAGVFDRFPALQLILGHAGEGLPFMLARSAERLRPAMTSMGIKRDLHVIMKTNISITTAGFFTLPVLKLLMAVLPIERIIYSVDYPFSQNTTGLAFLKEIRQSGIMNQAQFDAFTHGNARRLLKL